MKIYIIGHKNPDLDSIVSTIEYKEFLEKSKRYEGSEIIPTRAGEINKETAYALKKFGIDPPKSLDDLKITPQDTFILVDHNEETQRHEKINPDQVIEIVDHHKVNVSFTSPVRLDVRPVGCTSTIIYETFEINGLTPSETAQSLMLAAILSDTQGLKASTTTGIDSEIAKDLAKKLKIDLNEFTFELFKAKSDITGLSVEEIAQKDYKIFTFGKTKVFINQVETVEPQKIVEMKKDLVAALEEIKSKEGVGQTYLVITDILNVNSHVIYTTEEEEMILEKAFTSEGKSGIIDIGPRMSRKKDIAPAIEAVILKQG